MSDIWSNTDFPYMCLKDEIRTKAFRNAIQSIVKKGDVVIDIGSGSGILSFFAAEAGAKKVHAVEIDHLLAESLRKSIKANRYENVIEVVEGDIRETTLPKNCNVVIAEIIETGLIEELQVPVINMLRQKEVISINTQMIPSIYKTNLQLVYSDNKYYGFTIFSPKHEWPFYDFPNTNWEKTSIEGISNIITLSTINFSQGIIDENVKQIVTFTIPKDKKINGIRISGIITLASGIDIGPTNALNGDKIISLDLIEGVEEINLEISYKLGGGLGSLQTRVI